MSRSWPLHGTPERYRKGCRCYWCAEADTEYNRLHRPLYRRLKVPSNSTRRHIAWLNSHSMGNDSIAACCGVGHATVMKIRQGKSITIYRRTEQRILSVTPEGLSDGCRVDPTVTRQLIRELLEEGNTSRQLLRELGYKRTDLFMLRSKRVFAKTQLRVEKLYRKAMKDGLERAA